MHCQQGGKFELEMACCTHLEGFQVVSSYFWALAVSHVASAWPVMGTGLTGVVPRCWAIFPPIWSVRVTGLIVESWADAAALFHEVVRMHSSRGSCMCAWWAPCDFELWCGGLRSILEHSFVSDVFSHYPCLRGPRLVFFKWSFYVPLFGIRSLVGVSFYSFLFFFFSLVFFYLWVLSMHTSRGRLRTMCGLRTSGWSLPGVMSDWQCCVDWFLAKYCRCRLWLDWSWCRWRTSAKGRRLWGLLVWRRQAGFIRRTRWPAESSAGRMVAWTAR
jgi:hypothetical protein